MIPHPAGSDSAWRTGKGFQMSNTLKSIKLSNKYFQLTGASAKNNARNCPEVSSITTNCGSLIPEKATTRFAAHTPMKASTAAIIAQVIETRNARPPAVTAGEVAAPRAKDL